MSEENVEVLRALNDAANRLDLDAFLACLSRNVIWEENPEIPGLRKVYRGRAEVREWM
jgi:ketosteroid isomerase-like protein